MSTIESAINTLRAAPPRTLDEVDALLSAVVECMESARFNLLEFDLDDPIGFVGDARTAIKDMAPIDRAAIAADDAAEAWGDERRAA